MYTVYKDIYTKDIHKCTDSKTSTKSRAKAHAHAHTNTPTHARTHAHIPHPNTPAHTPLTTAQSMLCWCAKSRQAHALPRGQYYCHQDWYKRMKRVSTARELHE